MHSERIVRQVCRGTVVLCAGAVAACATGVASPSAGDAGPVTGNLLAIARFESPESATDPDAAHRESGCPLGVPRVEDGTLELETSACIAFWVGIPLLAGVRAGEALTLVTTHSALAARAPGEAHLRIDLDDEVLSDRLVPIPSSDAIDVTSVTPARAHGAGSRLRVHLHNHGANSWRVVSLARP